MQPIQPDEADTVTACSTLTTAVIASPAMGPYMNVPMSIGTSAMSYSKKNSAGIIGKRTTYMSTSDIAHSSASLTSFSTRLFLKD